MSNFNPMAGGPAHIIALRNALEERSEFKEPPRTGGKQQSIRLDDALIQQVEVISKLTGWNRSEIFSTLIQRGLFDLYEFSDDAVVKKIIDELSVSIEQMALATDVKMRIRDVLFHFSRLNREFDDWEFTHLSEAISEFRRKNFKLALLSVNSALIPPDGRSKDPIYVKLIPKKDRTLEDLKREFENEI
jgi:predicted DNA-binding protein